MTTTIDLTDDERLALAGLVRLMVKADGEFSPEEAGAVAEMAQDLGEAPFWAAIDRAAQELTDDDKIRAAARAVTRADARETIYGALLGLSQHGATTGGEDDLLEWLADEWELEISDVADESPN